MPRKIPDEKRTRPPSFNEISDSLVDDLQHTRSAIRSALDEEDHEKLDHALKDTTSIKP